MNEMTQSEDPRIDKIRKLFAMAEGVGLSEAARDNYRDKANELLVKWEIDEAQLTADGTDRLKNESIVTVTIRPPGPTTYGYEYSVLGVHAANATGMRGALTKGWNPDKHKTTDAFIVVGFESDVARFQILYGSLARQLTAAMALWAKNLGTYLSASQKYNERRGFIKGFAYRVSDRLETLRKAQVDEYTKTSGNGAELVLVDRNAQVERFATNLGWGKGRARKSGISGQYAGRVAGSSADIGQSRFGSGAGARGALGS